MFTGIEPTLQDARRGGGVRALAVSTLPLRALPTLRTSLASLSTGVADWLEGLQGARLARESFVLGNAGRSEGASERLAELAERRRLVVFATVWPERDANDQLRDRFVAQQRPERTCDVVLDRSAIQRADRKRERGTVRSSSDADPAFARVDADRATTRHFGGQVTRP